jgi:hypothetical protein
MATPLHNPAMMDVLASWLWVIHWGRMRPFVGNAFLMVRVPVRLAEAHGAKAAGH